MKKITNNAKWSKLVMLFNIITFVSFIITTTVILSFDKVNTELIYQKPKYDTGMEHLREVEHPRKQALKEVEFYTVKLDTLSLRKTANDKAAKDIQDEISRTKSTLSDKKQSLASIDSTIHAETAAFAPTKDRYDELTTTAEASKKIVHIWMWITIALIVIKTLLFANWNYATLKNLHTIALWMKKSISPIWAFISWIIPVYNFIKPFTVMKETWDETEYALTNHNIVNKKDISQNSEFNLSIWWGLLLIAYIGIPLILHSTFFTPSAMFFKFNHIGVIVVAITFWALFIALEIIILNNYNKLNKTLVDNTDKL